MTSPCHSASCQPDSATCKSYGVSLPYPARTRHCLIEHCKTPGFQFHTLLLYTTQSDCNWTCTARKNTGFPVYAETNTTNINTVCKHAEVCNAKTGNHYALNCYPSVRCSLNPSRSCIYNQNYSEPIHVNLEDVSNVFFRNIGSRQQN